MKSTIIKSISFRILETLLQELHYVCEYEGKSMNSQIFLFANAF